MVSGVAIVAGLVLLAMGGELLVRGASHLAVSAGITPIVVGLTVVAFGTSAPELAVSIGSSIGGAPEVAVGNGFALPLTAVTLATIVVREIRARRREGGPGGPVPSQSS